MVFSQPGVNDDGPAGGEEGVQETGAPAADQTHDEARPAGGADRGGAGRDDAGTEGEKGAEKRGADKGSSSDGLTLRDATDGFGDQPEDLERGGHIFRPGIEAVVRGGKHVHVGNQYTYLSTRTVAQDPGPVRPEILAAAARRYAVVSFCCMVS